MRGVALKVGACADIARLPWRLSRAWWTLQPKDWSGVADGLAALSKLVPALSWPERLHVRALRSARRFDEAIVAAEAILARNPGDTKLRIELGRALHRRGSRREALDAIETAWRLGDGRAAAELVRLGARHVLPSGHEGVFARSEYAALASASPVPAPPAAVAAASFRISFSGRPDARLLHSLAGQSHPLWFGPNIGERGNDWPPVYDVELPAGAVLDRHCLAWFNWAIAATGAATVRADVDRLGAHGGRCDVWLQPVGDRLWEAIGPAARRANFVGPSATIPLVLITLPEGATSPVPSPLPDAIPPRLSIIIPTRGNCAMLDPCIRSLFSTASAPHQLELVVVDNGVSPERTADLLRARREGAQHIVMPSDDAFNWSIANNLGADAARGDLLVFMNDDMEMQTAGWDRILAGMFDNSQLGLVGARMVYPNGLIQHGGFVFSAEQAPQHEGRWSPAEDSGPGGRWTAIREAPAVTGAFMALRAQDFAALGGFDSGYAVDFGDLDMAMQVRSTGQIVAYCGAITLLHHESVSRGLNLSRRQRRRALRELSRFEHRWGPYVSRDPGYHPLWARDGASHDGMRPLRPEEVVRHVLASVDENPWRTRRFDQVFGPGVDGVGLM